MQYPIILSAFAVLASANNYQGQTACVKGTSCNANQQNNNLNFCCDGTKMLTCGPAGPTAHWQFSSDCSAVGQCFADASWAGCTGSSSDSSYYSPPAQQYNQPPPPPQQYKQSSRIRVANYGGYEQGASCVGHEGKYACGEGNNIIYVCGPAGPTAHWQYSDNCGKYGLVCSVSNAFSGFCSRAETLLPVLNILSEKIGTKSTVTLLSCVRAETLLPVLDRLYDHLGTESAVRLLSHDSFCACVDTLMAKFPDIQTVLGEKGDIRVLSNDSLASMDAAQWQESMEFIRNAQPEHVILYLGTLRMVGKCKKVGWGKCADLYQKASEQEKTRTGFEKLVDEYTQKTL
ncbi:hypothetical protein HDU77_008196 [Chytriomyces hyalinus]|nr:hypothetical protein HDU77_008196 [Chytriomyces hyalinus]